MKPGQVTKANEGEVWHTLYDDNTQMRVRFKFQVDRERISKVKRFYKRSYLPQFTEELFIVYKLPRQIPVYKLNRYETDFIENTPQTDLPGIRCTLIPGAEIKSPLCVVVVSVSTV